MEKVLAPGEVLLVDTHSLVGYAESVTYDVRTTGGCITCCCGGEGLFNTFLVGPGLVIVQSMSQLRLRQAVGAYGGGGGNTSSVESG